MVSCTSTSCFEDLMIYQSVIEVFACGSCCFNSISRVLLEFLKSISFSNDSIGIGKNKVIKPEFVICLILGKQSTGLFPNGQVIFVYFSGGNTRILRETSIGSSGPPLIAMVASSL
jgi:hypothetical protein